jgi:nicotinate-nucleotide pyrophosphorylase (carboxylating)
MNANREQQIERAFFRGETLTLENPAYRQAVSTLTSALLENDLLGGDLTAAALGFTERRASAVVLAREHGVIAGLEELTWLYRRNDLEVAAEKRDGERIARGDIILRVDGDESKLLALERVGLNLVQRMSGIATTSACAARRMREAGSETHIVGTRKTPWGLLDKRALHVGGAGTHRLGLGDAILVKNNHLALLAPTEEEAAEQAIAKAWAWRGKSALIEVEVRTEPGAIAAAESFRRLQDNQAEDCPCVLMFDNMAPSETGRLVRRLHEEGLWDYVLVEASGGISESNLREYAATGVDVISIGALTHSVRALDISQRIS